MSIPPTPSAAAPSQGALLPPDLHDLVVELAVAVHKRRIYPAGHPMQHGAADQVLSRLTATWSGRTELTVQVAGGEIVVDGAAADASNPLVRDLGEQLHDHQLAAVRFRRETTLAELEALIAELARPARRGGVPLGARPVGDLPHWTNVVLHPVLFGRISLLHDDDREDGGHDRPGNDALWLALSHAALDGDEHNDGVPRDPRGVARLMNEAAARGDVDLPLFDRVISLMHRVPPATDGGGGTLRSQLSELVTGLTDQARAQLLALGRKRDDAPGLLERATATLAADAVVELLHVAASDAGKPIAAPMLRLLAKLSRDAGSRRAVSAAADRTLREIVHRMTADWQLTDPAPEQYAALLSGLATEGATSRNDKRRDVCEPERVVEIGLETGCITPAIEQALGRLVLRDGLGAALDFLLALDDSAAREQLVESVLNDASFREQLTAERPDLSMLQHAVDRKRGAAVLPLVHALERRSESDAEWIVALLVRVGPAGVAQLGANLAHLSPRALRHVVTVFAKLGEWPGGVMPQDFAHHPDPALRREVVRSLLARPDTRDAGIVAGVRDADNRIFNLALGAALRGCPLPAARTLMVRVTEPALTSELRARCIRAAGTVSHPDVRAWLIAQASTPRWLSRGRKLRKASPEVTAALGALASAFGNAPDAAAILALARASRDETLRRAARPRHTPSEGM